MKGFNHFYIFKQAKKSRDEDIDPCPLCSFKDFKMNRVIVFIGILNLGICTNCGARNAFLYCVCLYINNRETKDMTIVKWT